MSHAPTRSSLAKLRFSFKAISSRFALSKSRTSVRVLLLNVRNIRVAATLFIQQIGLIRRLILRRSLLQVNPLLTLTQHRLLILPLLLRLRLFRSHTLPLHW